VLVQHASAVTGLDRIQDEDAVDQLYAEEMTELLREVTGASKVVMLGGGKKRYGEGASHTAFTDPTGPPGTPTRVRAEMRGLGLFK
jgi:hypothetical protein